MTPNEGFIVSQRDLERGQRLARPPIADSDEHIPQEPPAFGTLDRTPLKPAAELRLCHVDKREQLRREIAFAWLERRFGCRCRLAVPRADLLADVASKDEVAHFRTQFLRDVLL